MSNLDLKDYLFRVYTKFRAVDLTSHSDLKSKVGIIEQYNLTKLVRILVFGCIDSKNCNPLLVQDEILDLLYDSDGKSSALALSLLNDNKLYKVDLGRLLINSSNTSGTKYQVSLSTFMLILLFYSSVDYINIGLNMKIAIDRFVSYAKNSYLENRFPEIKQDLPLLETLLKEGVTNDVKPSRFHDVIQDIGKQLQEYVKPLRDKDKNNFTDFWNGLLSSLDKDVSLSDLMDAMFELFKAGYYPASISSVFPDTVLATIPGKSVSGQLDYILLLDQEKCPTSLVSAGGEDDLVRVVFTGSYADKSLLFEYESRWRLIEERLPGVWKLFRIIYKRLENGEYNTSKHKFSEYQFVIKDDGDRKVSEAAKVRWLNLFSSFILGHVINLIATGSAKQVYKVAAPVIYNRNVGSYLVPADFYRLQKPIIYYVLNENIIEPKYHDKHEWYQYRGDSVYTPTSSSVSDIASYTSSYAIVINNEQFTDVNIKSYGGHINDWNEVVEAEVVSREGLSGDSTPDTLNFKLYGDDGEVVEINLKASSVVEGDEIEPSEIKLE